MDVRLRLRSRIIALFAFGGLSLSVILGLTTYALARDNLLRQREINAVDQAAVNAAIVQTALATSGEVEEGDDVTASVVQALSSPGGALPLVNLGADNWRGSAQVSQADLPAELVERVLDDRVPARMRFGLRGEASLAVGIPLPRSEASYFEVADLAELESNLALLALVLAIGGLVTTLSGSAFGVWAARRVLSPLGDISSAATAIAGGRLDTRLEDPGDPDLAALVTSFNNMAAGLQERIDRDARFASDVSHELRSPLMTIRASLEVLEGRREELSERSGAALDLLTHDIDRFERLIGDLLEISRIDAGKVDESRDVVAPGGFVSAVVNELHDAGVPVVVDPELSDAAIAVDKRRMAQVIANLLNNAEHYAGGATRVLVVREGDEVRIVVEDQGPGVPAEERTRIFGRFARGSTAGQRGWGGGTGLGLALVDEHVRLHGGRVWVEDRSDDRTGARFVVALPLYETAAV